jgi:hypothetical protein
MKARMEGEIIYPGDLHGRVIRANAVELAWDGNALSALVGEDLIVGVCGFGDSVHAALRELAENLIREGVWIEIPGEGEIDIKSPPLSGSGTVQTDSLELHRLSEGRMAAVVRAAGGAPGAAVVTGESVHEALRALSNELVAQGIWIEVTARREWHFVEPPATMLPHSDFGDADCCGLLRGVVRDDTAHIECNECGAVVRVVPPAELRKMLTEMELELAVAAETCPYCGAANLFPGFSRMDAYVCRQCGESVKVADRE